MENRPILQWIPDEFTKKNPIGTSMVLDNGKTYIVGRGRDCDIIVPSEYRRISSKHLALRVADGCVYLGNLNIHKAIGTYLNNEQLFDCVDLYSSVEDPLWIPLTDGDEVLIGGVEEFFCFTVSGVKQKKDQTAQDNIEPAVDGRLFGFRSRKNVKKEKPTMEEILSEVREEITLSTAPPNSNDLLDVNPVKQAFMKKNYLRPLHLQEDWSCDKDDLREKIIESIGKEPGHTIHFPKFTEVKQEKKKVVPEIKKYPGKSPEKPKKDPVPGREEDRPKAQRKTVAAVKTKKDYTCDFPFRKLEQVGVGGFSTVDLMEDLRDGERFIRKNLLLKNEYDTRSIRKIMREAEIGMKMDHPNLVKTYDLRTEPDYCMFMEYCDSGSLETLMKSEGYLEIEEATRYIFQVLDGLDYMHNFVLTQKDEDGNIEEVQGIVHRDIKPANLLLKMENGEYVVKISDFGLSKAFELAGKSGLTGAEFGGTPRFVSKRQFSYNFIDAGPSEDIFSAAAVYYYLLTGKIVRPHENINLLKEDIRLGNLVPIRKANPKIPKALANVIDSVLAEEKRHTFDEYTDAKAFKNKIMKALDL